MTRLLYRNSICVAFLLGLLLTIAAPTASAAHAPMTVDADLNIYLKDMSPTAVFYPVQLNGKVAEFFAVKAPDSTIRIVVNACQACGPAGFVQEGDNFICTSCNQKFHVTSLEKQKGGCNPIPVGDANKKIEPDRIILPVSFMKKVTESRFAKK